MGRRPVSEFSRAYWDSCAWLGLLNSEPAKVKPLRHLYESARRNQFEIWTSAIAYVEVFRLVSETNDSKPLGDENLDLIRDVIEQPFVKLIPVDMEIGREARRLRRQLPNFKGAGDAVHLASAIKWNVNPLHTWDGAHLLHLDKKLKCKDGTTLEICRPSNPESGPLFAEKEVGDGS